MNHERHEKGKPFNPELEATGVKLVMPVKFVSRSRTDIRLYEFFFFS